MGSSLTLQVANGNAFFFGLAVVVLASLCRLPTEKKAWRTWIRITAVIGATLILVSATPLAIWVHLIWLTLFILTFALPMRFRQSVIAATSLLTFLSAVMWLHELHFRHAPIIPVQQRQTIYIIGDSISAGIRNEKQPWPERLRHNYQLDVVNLAQAGATIESAIQQVQQVDGANCVAILEIGGNDFFGATTSSEFATHLDHLLALLAKPERTIAMFELPLLPFHNGFGRAQRMLAAKYKVALIPKTYMARILGKSGATLDGLHLSQSGHEAMAQMVYQTLRVEGPPEAAASKANFNN